MKKLLPLLLMAAIVAIAGCGGGSGSNSSPASGTITVTSNPPGATIYLDDTNTEMITPATLTGVPVGLHHVEIELSGYQTIERSVTVTGGKTTDLSVTLTQSNSNDPKPTGHITLDQAEVYVCTLLPAYGGLQNGYVNIRATLSDGIAASDLEWVHSNGEEAYVYVESKEGSTIVYRIWSGSQDQRQDDVYLLRWTRNRDVSASVTVHNYGKLIYSVSPDNLDLHFGESATVTATIESGGLTGEEIIWPAFTGVRTEVLSTTENTSTCCITAVPGISEGISIDIPVGPACADPQYAPHIHTSLLGPLGSIDAQVSRISSTRLCVTLTTVGDLRVDDLVFPGHEAFFIVFDNIDQPDNIRTTIFQAYPGVGPYSYPMRVESKYDYNIRADFKLTVR